MRPLLFLLMLLVAGGVRAASDSAQFAGGCFWCMEADFEKLPGVTRVVSGYAGGTLPRPRYEQVSEGGSGHYESVEVTYDPARVSYEQLLQHFWRNVDPLDGGGQFCDRGDQYRSAIFVRDAAQRAAAERSLQAVRERLRADPATPILPAGTFWPAEGYHQDYARSNPLRYRYYRHRCGRDQRLETLWGARAH